MVKIGYFLVGSWERVVYYQMDPGRVPDLRDAHLAEHLDSERPSTILGHGHIGRQNRDFSWMMYLLAAFGSNADDLLGKSQRIIVQDILVHRGSRERKIPAVIKDEI